jgi:hypothetical protein
VEIKETVNTALLGCIFFFHDPRERAVMVKGVFQMKNTIKLLGIIAIIALIGLSFAGCDTGGDSPAPAPGPSGPPPPQKTVYTWVAGDDSYTLEITESTEGRAAYTPRSGDNYVLTITPKVGKPQRSIGTVAVTPSNSSDKESTLTLTPANSETTFTVTVVATATNVLVKEVEGTITLESGETKEAPTEEVIPTKTYATFDFKAHMSDRDINNFETWLGTLPLSDFTYKIPQKGDKFTFRLSGTTNNEMNWFGFLISNYGMGKGWHLIGHIINWTNVKLSGTFNELFDVIISQEPPIVDGVFALHMENNLWQTNPDDGTTVYDNGAKLPAGTQRGDVMATIRNFTVSLVKIEEADEED